ncbi:hypothetical protein D3C77_34360 [compost metagenome]
MNMPAIVAAPVAFVGAAQINRAIDAIEVRGKELDEAIQMTGLSILHHIEVCGDYTIFKRLFAAMPKGARKNALVEWACMFGKVKVNLDKATAKDMPFLYDATTDLAQAAAQPWYTFKPEKAPVEEFNLFAALAHLRKQVAQAQTKGLPVKGAELLGDFEVLAARALSGAEQAANATTH